MIVKDNKKITRIFKGTQEIDKVFFGGNLVFNRERESIKNSETLAVIEYGLDMGYQISAKPYLQKLDNHISELKGFGLFAKLDLAYWMIGDGDLNFKTINIINPALSGTTMGGLINTLQGIEGNGVDGYIDTGFNATVGINKYTLNNAARGAFVYKEGEGTNNRRFIDGTKVNSYDYLRTANIAGSINSSNGANSVGFMQGVGFKLIGRDSNNKVQLVSNNLNVEVDDLSDALRDTNQLLLGSGANLTHSDVGLSSYFMGASLTFEETQLYRQAILNNL